MDYIDLDEEDQKQLIEKKLKIIGKSAMIGTCGMIMVIIGKHIF